MNLFNQIFISKLNLIITVQDICLPSSLSGRKEYPTKVKNEFNFEYESPVMLSELSLSDLELESGNLLCVEDPELAFALYTVENKLKIGFDGRYYGLYAPVGGNHFSFNIMVLENCELKKIDGKYTLFLEFKVTDSLTSFTPSSNKIKVKTYKKTVIKSKKNQDEIENEQFEQMTLSLRNTNEDESEKEILKNAVESLYGKDKDLGSRLF